MKKFVFASLLILIAFSGKINAQNLEFNQVVSIFHHITNTSVAFTTDSMTVVVPAGKVWKITSSACSELYDYSSYDERRDDPSAHVALNGVILGSADLKDFARLPLWLGPGSYAVSFQGDGGTSSQYSWDCMISAIEFNVVP